jgi:hypothetical protein
MEFRRETAALAELEDAAAELEARGSRTEAEVRGWSPLSGGDLAALGRFQLYVERRAKEVAARRAEQARKLAECEQAMLEARRRCRLLERLRERRLAEWRSATGRELEEIAAESHLARFVRQSSIMDE